jgi:DNA-binding SARP family transcriptional activator/WD40 repeat protein
LKRDQGAFRTGRGGRINVAMWFGVLGPLEVRDDVGQLVRIGGSVRRELLAALLCRAGQPVPAAALIDDIWGDVPPRTAAKTLQSHVVRLRHDLPQSGGAVILTENAGYRLSVSTAMLDVGCFEAELKQGLAAYRREDDRAAITHLDAALALWRGEAYLDFADAPFALAERVRLADLRAMALETRTDAALRLGEAATLVSELEARIQRAPYRERSWEQLILALYRSGRQADALAAYRMAHQRLSSELGVDPGPGLRGLESQILNQDPRLLGSSGSTPPAGSSDALAGQCPYRGLAGYGSDDAAVFVGRERLTAVLAGRLADSRVVVVAGASGSGKSSAVRAGLLPALRAGALPQSAAWRVAVTTPTTGVGTDAAADLLVLDQAEELFTVLDESGRTAVLTRLRRVVEDGGRLVLVLRGDFFATLAEVPWLAHYAQRDPVLVGRMREDELARVIVEPARRAGVRVADEVVETVLAESAGQAQPLPLVSVALVRAWEERDGDVITLEAYQASGGLIGAIEATAEATYARLPEVSRPEARRLLVRMAVREGATWTRRPVQRSSLSAVASSTTLDALAEGRLITITDGRVELSHDALLEQWPRLRGWLDERVMAAGLLDHLTAAADAWVAGGRQETDLHRGPRLRASLDWRDAHPDDLSAEESEFLTASADALEASERAALRSAHRTARRLRLLVAGLLVFLLAAVAGGLLAVHQRSVARGQTLRAEVSRMATLASSLPDDQRDLALLLGAEAYRLHSSDQAAGGLQTALMQTPPGLDRMIRYRSTSHLPHLDPTGRLLAVPGDDGTVTVHDLFSGRVLHTLRSSTPRQFAVFSGDDRLVAAGGSDGTVVIWDMTTGQRSGRPLPVGGGVVRPVFDPRDHNRLYVMAAGGGLTAWDRSVPGRPRRLDGFGGVTAFPTTEGAGSNLTISPDGRFIAGGELDPGTSMGDSTGIWETRSRKLLRGFNGAIGVLADDSRTLPFGYGNDTVLMDVGTGRIEQTVPNTGGEPLSTISRNGRRLAVSRLVAGARVVAVYDLGSHQRVGQLKLQGDSAFPVGFLADGRLLTSSTNRAAIWTIGKDLPPLGVRLRAGNEDEVQQPFFLPRSRTVVTLGSSTDRHRDPLVLHDAAGRPIGRLLNDVVFGEIVASPDGRLIVGRRRSGGLGLWDAHTGQLLARLPVAHNMPLDSWAAPRWSPRGDLVVADVGGAAYAWTVSDPRHPSGPRLVRTPRGEVVDDVVFSPDGQRLIAVTGGHERISVVVVRTGRTAWTRNVGATDVRQVAVSPDGTTISYNSGGVDGGRVTVLDAMTGRREATIPTLSDGGVGYLHDGGWLVVTTDQPEPQAQLYDLRTRQAIGVPFPTGAFGRWPVVVDPTGTRFAEIHGSAYSVDSRQSLATLHNETNDPLMWTVDPARWAATACNIAGRNLTRAEWQQYLPDRRYRSTCPQWPAGP